MLGSLWNGKDLPPADNKDGKNDIRKITSREKHQLIFDDGGKGGITLVHSSGTTVVLTEKQVEVKAGKSKVTVEDGTQISVETSGDVNLKGKNVTVSATASLKLKGAQVEVKGTPIKLN